MMMIMKQMSSLRWLWNQTRCHRLDIVANSVVGIVRASAGGGIRAAGKQDGNRHEESVGIESVRQTDEKQAG